MATRTELTRQELATFPDDGHRYELVDGRLLVSPLARHEYQRVVLQVARRLADWVDEGGHGFVYPGVNVELASDTHLEPDVAWSATSPGTRAGFTRTPELVVEVLSTFTAAFDRGVKLDRYAATGAREVWLVDLDAGTVEQFPVGDGVAVDPSVHGVGATFTSPLFDGLDLSVDDLLR